MSQMHFQKELFQEIIQGIATSCEGYLLDGKEMIESAANIYLSMQHSEASAAAEETSFYTEPCEAKTCMYSRISVCKVCGHKTIRFVADGVKYCQGCGRRVMEDDRR